MSELDELFSGPLERFGGALLLAEDGRESFAGDAFLEPATLRGLMARGRPHFAAEDLRAVATLWSKHYFVRLLLPVLCATLLGQRALPLRIESLRVLVDEQGRPQAFCLPHAGQPLAASAAGEGLLSLLNDNLAPFIDALSACSGLTGKVLWSNAGNYFEAALRQLAGLVDAPASLAAGETLLQARWLPDGRRNPLFEPVRYVAAEHTDGITRIWRKRRLCCIRDLLPDVELCPNCPRLKVPPAPRA